MSQLAFIITVSGLIKLLDFLKLQNINLKFEHIKPKKIIKLKEEIFTYFLGKKFICINKINVSF